MTVEASVERSRGIPTGRWEYWESSLSELGWTLLITADLFIAHTLCVQVQVLPLTPLPHTHTAKKQQATRRQPRLAG